MEINQEDVQSFIDLTIKRDEQRAILKSIEDERAKVEARLGEAFTLAGVQNIKVNGHTVYKQVDSYISIKPECQRDAVAVAEGLGLEELIVLQPQRFKSWAKEQLDSEEAGHRLPDEFTSLVNQYETISVRVRKS